MAEAPAPDAQADVLSYDAKECALATGYLESRTLPDAESRTRDCVKTWDYVASRTLPEPARPAAASTLQFDYTYDPAGHVTSQTRTLTEPAEAAATAFAGATTLEHVYDRVGRLVETASSDGSTGAYAYDPAGNRVGHTRRGETSFEQVAAYDPAGQLRQTVTSGDVAGSASFGYDRAGHRTSQVVDGVATQFGFDPTGRTTSLATDGRALAYGYDALGRRTATSETTEFGTQSSTQYWSGTTPSAVSTAGQDAVALVRDVTGELAVQASAGEVSWTLLDRLASTVATTDVSGQLSQLAGYADHGTPDFATAGWGARLNFTGEPDDPPTGTTAFFARSYDTTTGTFTSRDLWRGDQTAPQTLNRYAYVLNDPATYIDVLGFRIGDPGAYNTTSEAKVKAMRAADNATNLEVANNRLRATGQPPIIRTPERDHDAIALLHAAATTDAADLCFRQNPGNLAQCMLGGWIDKTRNSVAGWLERLDGVAIANALNGSSGLGAFVALRMGLRPTATKDGVIVFEAPGSGGTITIGNVMITTGTAQHLVSNDLLWAHEYRHAEQWSELGLVGFGATWVSGWLLSFRAGALGPGGGGCLNILEIDAEWEGTSYASCRAVIQGAGK